MTTRQVISLLGNLNARKRSNTPMVHGSGINQVAPVTKLSTLAFAPANRQTAERTGIRDSVFTSIPIRSVVSQNESISYSGIEDKLDAAIDEIRSSLRTNIV